MTHPAAVHTRTGAAARAAALALIVSLGAAGCSDGASPGDPVGTPTSTPTPSASATTTELPDGATAADLVADRFAAVHGLPPTSADELDVPAVVADVTAAGSPEAERVTGVLEQAVERGVLDRGDVRVEALDAPEASDDGAQATLCMSQDVRTTELETGEDTGAPAPPTDWLRIVAEFIRQDGSWALSDITAAEPADCIPPSIQEATAEAWEVFAEARVDHEARGGGPDIGDMSTVVTDRFAETLQSIGPFEPPTAAPPPYQEHELETATRTTAIGRACRDGQVETVEWQLAEGQWLIDFAGQDGEEATAC